MTTLAGVSPTALIATAILLGLFVLAGGGYGTLYGAGRLMARRGFRVAGYACYIIQVALVVVIVWMTPLDPMWKAFIALSGLAYAFIPPVTWRYVEQMHHSEDDHGHR